MVIYIISDEKKGHLSQTRGLAGALLKSAQEKQPTSQHSVHEISIVGKTWFSRLFYKGKDLDLPEPSLILCAGHSTHLAAISLARHKKCPIIVCMKPSLPLSMFDLCVLPRHDIPEGKSPEANVFLTNGAINNIKPQPEVEKKETLILIGGPSKEFDWDAETVLNQLTTIVRHSTNNIVLTTSRRTPKDFVKDVTAACPSIRVDPVETTGPNWVAEHLASAKEVWVTQDSVSMVFESLSSGAPVGLIEMKRKRSKKEGKISRVSRGLNMLAQDGDVCTFTDWAKSHHLPSPNKCFDEAGRAAAYIIERFPALLN